MEAGKRLFIVFLNSFWPFIFLVAVSPRLQGARSTGAVVSNIEARGGGADSTKRRRISSAKLAAEGSSSSDDTLSALPCLVTLNPGVRIASVSAGGRHTLALSGDYNIVGTNLVR